MEDGLRFRDSAKGLAAPLAQGVVSEESTNKPLRVTPLTATKRRPSCKGRPFSLLWTPEAYIREASAIGT